MSSANDNAPLKACAICGKPAVARYRPFCSRRCADIDLGRWFAGGYGIPAVEPPDDFDSEDLGRLAGFDGDDEA